MPVSVPSSSGLRLDKLATRTAGRSQFQFLLLQDFGWTPLPKGCGKFVGVSVPSSSGLRLDIAYGNVVLRPRFSSFFFRTSAGPCPTSRYPLDRGFSSFFFRTSAGQGFSTRWLPRRCFSSFFFRTSAGRTWKRGPAPLPFQFLLLQDFGWTSGVSVATTTMGFSSFFFRTSAGRGVCDETPPRGLFQFLLLQDFGWTYELSRQLEPYLFQFLLLQDFGWT